MAVRCQQNLRPRPHTNSRWIWWERSLEQQARQVGSSVSAPESSPTVERLSFRKADSPATQHCGGAAFQHQRTTPQFNYCGGTCGSALRTAPHSALLDEPVVQHRGQLHAQHCWMDLWFSTADSSALSSVVQHRGQLRSQRC